MKAFFSICAAALAIAFAGSAQAKEVGPVTPPIDVPSFTLTVPNYANFNGSPVSVTFNGTIASKYAPAGPVKCPVTVEYDVKVSMTQSIYSPTNAVAAPVSYSWAPSKSLTGMYDVANAQAGQALLSAPLVSSIDVTYKASTPAEGMPVSFYIQIGNQPQKQMLRVVSHVQCLGVRAPRI